MDVTDQERLFLPDRALKKFIKEQATPFYLYDEKSIRSSAQRLKDAFEWCEDFGLFFPVRMNPNASILRILQQSGCGVSCCSEPELMLCEKIGFSGDRILFAPMKAERQADELCRKLDAIRVIDSDAVLPDILPSRVLLRLDISSFDGRKEPVGTGKFGMTEQKALEVIERLHEYKDCTIGLCAEGAAMAKSLDYFRKTAERLFSFAASVQEKTGVCIDAVHLGNGLPFDYRHTGAKDGLREVSESIRLAADRFLQFAVPGTIRLSMEPGRFLLAGAGIFVTSVCAVKDNLIPLIVTDGCMATFGRLSQLGNYHLISVLGKHDARGRTVCHVAGCLPDSRDIFARGWLLPPVRPGDCILIHDVGADGASMQNGYGGNTPCAQFLHAANGTLRLIAGPQSTEQWLSGCGLEL